MFLVEQAWWYYEVCVCGSVGCSSDGVQQHSRRGSPLARALQRAHASPLTPQLLPPSQDNIRDTNGLRSYNLRDFAQLVFKTCPELRKHVVRALSLSVASGPSFIPPPLLSLLLSIPHPPSHCLPPTSA